jgi:hypothetical protein
MSEVATSSMRQPWGVMIRCQVILSFSCSSRFNRAETSALLVFARVTESSENFDRAGQPHNGSPFFWTIVREVPATANSGPHKVIHDARPVRGETTLTKHRVEKSGRVDTFATVQDFNPSATRSCYLEHPFHEMFGCLSACCRSRFLSFNAPAEQDGREQDCYFWKFHTQWSNTNSSRRAQVRTASGRGGARKTALSTTTDSETFLSYVDWW